tara:strand:- start:19220 stop:19732 length:513 start_codon:yes stop_codon:yes gene_type:complete
MLRSRSAQARITETIAVMFIFFILIMFGIIFYASYSKNAAITKQNELFSQNAIEITTKTLFMPELLCSKGEAEPEDFCLDVLKLKHSQTILEAHVAEYYFDILGYAKISVEQVYPNDGTTYTIYEKTKVSDNTKIPSKDTNFIVSLRDETAGQGGKTAYGVGLMTVEVYK